MTIPTRSYLTVAAEMCRTATIVAEHVDATLAHESVDAATVSIHIQPHTTYGAPVLVSVQMRSEDDLNRLADALGLGEAITYEVGPEEERYDMTKRAGDRDGARVDVYCRAGR